MTREDQEQLELLQGTPGLPILRLERVQFVMKNGEVIKDDFAAH